VHMHTLKSLLFAKKIGLAKAALKPRIWGY